MVTQRMRLAAKILQPEILNPPPQRLWHLLPFRLRTNRPRRPLGSKNNDQQPTTHQPGGPSHRSSPQHQRSLDTAVHRGLNAHCTARPPKPQGKDLRAGAPACRQISCCGRETNHMYRCLIDAGRRAGSIFEKLVVQFADKRATDETSTGQKCRFLPPRETRSASVSNRSNRSNPAK